jgi:hypothetical protein
LLHGQRRPLYFGNRALVLMTSNSARPVSASPVFASFFKRPLLRQAESFLTADSSTQSSIVNFAQGYSKVDPILATRFKR